MNANEYHSQRGYNFTAHMLMDLLNGKSMEEIFQFKQVDSDAYHFGEAAHVHILEGNSVFNDRYVVDAPINEKTGKPYGRKSKAYQIWLSELTSGIKAISPDDHDLLITMNYAVSKNERAMALLSDGIAEFPLIGDYGGYPCQSRLDWITPHPYIVDLKTCADMNSFEMYSRTYRYHNQMAFYREMFKYQWKTPVYLIAVSKSDQPECRVIRMKNRLLDQAQEENETKMEEVKEEFFACRSEFIARKKEEEACQLMQA